MLILVLIYMYMANMCTKPFHLLESTHSVFYVKFDYS